MEDLESSFYSNVFLLMIFGKLASTFLGEGVRMELKGCSGVNVRAMIFPGLLALAESEK